jgi:eukaryotic-like serine/threonine-protein kinase
MSIHTTHRWPKFLPDGDHFIYLAASHFSPASHDGIYFCSLNAKESKFLVPSKADATYASGYLFFLRKNVLMAQPFEAERGQLQGEPRPTVERVLYDPSIWKAVFDASKDSVMSYQLGDTVSGSQLRWFDRSGKQLAALGEPGFHWDMRLSRDGRRLAAGVAGGGYSNIWVYDFARGSRSQVTFSKYDNGNPIWSHDGTGILFSAKRQHYALYQVDSNGAEPEQLILDTGSDIWPLDLSSDGRFVLFGQGLAIGQARNQLWVYPMRGTPFRLFQGEAVEAGGQFSPDGLWIAFTSNESGKDEVYVVPFHVPSGSSARRSAALSGKWQISLSGGRRPRWRRDGRELFYIADDSTLMSVPVTGRGSKFEVGVPRPLFRANPGTPRYIYDVYPDGSRFIINTMAPPETTSPITLVENWLSDFKK